MRAVIQRVNSASVTVNETVVGQIQTGLLVFLGVTHHDTQHDSQWIADKILSLRVFEDSSGKMNRSIIDVAGSLLAVSQFTLYGRVDKGRRPSFDLAAAPDSANALYRHFVEYCKQYISVETGVFGAHMIVGIENNGPVTFVLEHPSQKKLKT